MKILYGEGDFLESRHQIIAYPASVEEATEKLDLEKEVMQRHPDVCESVNKMFAKNEHFEVVPPRMGDVIWTQTSGNKWIATCLIFDGRGDVNFDALNLCTKSIKKKMIELEQEEIGMPLRWYPDRNMKTLWTRTYDVMEEVLSDEDDGDVVGTYQLFAYDPDSKYVRDTIESLPGAKRAFYSDVKIQFRKF